MYEPVTPFDIRKKYLDQHFEQYVAFTRLILSLATGSFSLLAALSGNFLSSSQYVGLAKSAFPLLLVSMLAGVFVQHRLVLRPQQDLARAEKLLQEAEASGSTDRVILRRTPSLLERTFFNTQVITFLLAFVLLVFYGVAWQTT